MPASPPTDPEPAEPVPRLPRGAAAEPVEHAVLGGRGRLLQPARGYRAGLDAALLAAAVGARPGERVLEAGCGAGGALVQAALRAPGARFTGVERDPAAAALGARNLALNGLEARAAVRLGNVGAGFRAFAAASGEARFDAAFANPPYFDDPAALRAPSPERRGAWMADDGLAAWIGFLLDALREGGIATLVHRADRLGDILAALASRAGSTRVRPVHAFADAPAKRVLVRAARGGRAPLTLLAPLVLQRRGDPPTPDPSADAILRGEAELGWT